MDYSSIKMHFKIKEEHGYKAKAICPAHKDKEASLSISYDPKERKTLLYCHAGCETREIASTVGLKITDLFDRTLENTRDNNIEAVYQYKDESGNIVFEKVRFRPKRFSQRRYVGDAVIWGLDSGEYYETYPGSNNWSTKFREGAISREFSGITPILYNLNGIITAVKEGQSIYIVEGEKDADNLIKLGISATTSFDGASKNKQKQKWRDSYNRYFSGANVVLLGDNDESGRAHMEVIAKNLFSIANSIKIIKLDDVDNKEDVSDWLQKGHTVEELEEIVDNTLTYDRVDILDYNFSDVGNAERMFSVHGKNVKFNGLQQKWMIWSGRHWEMDENLKIERMAKEVIKRVQRAGENIIIPDDADYKTALKLEKYIEKVKSFVLKSEADNRIKAMINQTKSHEGVLTRDLDKDLYAFTLLNGTLNLITGQIKDHDRNDNITKLIDLNYSKNKKCDNWLGFLDKIFLGDKELIAYIQKSIGYSLTGATTEQCFYMCYGNGANGKSTLLRAIKAIMSGYADELKSNSLMVKRNDDGGARGDLAKLKGKRFVWVSEPNEGQVFDESLLKSLTGGDTIPVRYLYGEEFPLTPEFKLWIGTNKKPVIKGSDHGIWRRVRLIPFLYTFTEEEKDEMFYEKFIEPELEGILAWAVEGCLMWQSEGIQTPDSVLAAVEEYQEEMDSLAGFIEDCCIVGSQYSVKALSLYEEYKNWCIENGEHEMTNNRFGRKLKEKGFEKFRNMTGNMYNGIGLLELKEVVNGPKVTELFPNQTKMY